MGVTKPKTLVSRKIAVSLGIVCIILGTFLVGTTIYFTSTISDRNSSINQKDNVIADLNDTVNLQKYTVWVSNETVSQTAGNYTSWKFSATNAGFVQIFVDNLTGNDTYVRVIYNADLPVGPGTTQFFQYDNQFGGHGYREGYVSAFPLLPTKSYSLIEQSIIYVEVRIGNASTTENATETVTITYYY